MKVKRLITLLCLCLLLGGCFDQKELEDNAFVLGIGLDVGEHEPYRLTLSISKPTSLAGGEKGGGDNPTFLISTEADHVVEGLTEAGTLLGRRPSLLHATFIIVGKELASRGLTEVLAQLLPFREVRRSAAFLITPGTAEAFLRDAKPQIDKGLYRWIPQNLAQSRHHNMSTSEAGLSRFLTRLEGHGMGALAYQVLLHKDGPTEGTTHPHLREGPDLEMVGAGAFVEGKLVGTLTGHEVQYLRILQGKFKQARVALAEGDGAPPLGYELWSTRQPSYRLTKGDPWRIEINVPMEAELLGGRPGLRVTSLAIERELEGEIERYIEEHLTELLKRMQTELKADLVPIANHARRHFATYHDWINYNWSEAFQKAEIKTNVIVTLRRNGVQRPPLPH